MHLLLPTIPVVASTRLELHLPAFAAPVKQTPHQRPLFTCSASTDITDNDLPRLRQHAVAAPAAREVRWAKASGSVVAVFAWPWAAECSEVIVPVRGSSSPPTRRISPGRLDVHASSSRLPRSALEGRRSANQHVCWCATMRNAACSPTTVDATNTTGALGLMCTTP